MILALLLGCAAAASEGRDCPASPNCVSSLAVDAAHAAEPLRFGGDEAVARALLREIILAMPRTRVIEDREGYLHATFTSRLWRFVDDVEVWLDPATGRADIRSASRVGYGDMGVNRARVDALAAAWAANEPGTR